MPRWLTDALFPTACLLEAGADNQLTLQATLYNAGDYVAHNLTATITLPAGVSVTNTLPPAEVISQTVIWRELGDLAPGSVIVVELSALAPVNRAGQIGSRTAGAEPLFVPVINRSEGQFVDAFSEQLIQAQIGGEYRLPLKGGKPTALYLPLIFKNYNPLPDLIVDSVFVQAAGKDQSAAVTVVIKNQGSAPVTSEQEFWVDLYVDPNPAPAGVNQTWQMLSDEGIAWGITADALPLEAGGAITLTLDSPYFDPQESNFSGNLASETPIYVQVDAVDLTTTYGAVLETHEAAGKAYNNLFGPVKPVAPAASSLLSPLAPTPALLFEKHLPVRR